MGKEKKHGKHKKSKHSEPSAESQKFGPSLPPQSSAMPLKRDSWMSDESKSIFDTITQTKEDDKPKEKEEEKEYDYSAAGLHVMKKTEDETQNLFSRKSSQHSTDHSKHLAQMKARIKSYNKQTKSDTDADNKRSSHFRKPEQHSDRNRHEKYDHHKSSKLHRDRDEKYDDDHKLSKYDQNYNEKYDDHKSSKHGRDHDEKYDNHHKSSKHDRDCDKKYEDHHNSSNHDRNRHDKYDDHKSSNHDQKYDDHKSSKYDRNRDKKYDDHKSSKNNRDYDQSPDNGHGSKSGTSKSLESSGINTSNQMTDKPTTSTDPVSTNKESEEKPPVTDDDLNQLSAKIVKAEILGNQTKVDKLKKKLEDMQTLRKSQNAKARNKEETVILTVTDKKGNIRPVDIDDSERKSNRKRRKHKIMPTHDASGERDKYFPDDNNKDLADLVRDEKSMNKLGQDELFMKYAGKLSKMSQGRQDWTLDDMFESNIAVPNRKTSQNADKVISQNLKEHKRLESCHMCLEKCPKESIIHIGTTLYIRVPPYKSLAKNHCQIVPVNHLITSLNGDEDFWEELRNIKSKLVEYFKDKKFDMVFLEMARRLGARRHTFIDCIPVPFEESALLPAYFKKEILDCDVEWSQNKKLVDTRTKGLKRSVPQGLPYFSVEFGTDGGYAHVIEDEDLFKQYFGLEIVGGVLDCDVSLWRNPQKESASAIEYKKKIFEKLAIEF